MLTRPELAIMFVVCVTCACAPPTSKTEPAAVREPQVDQRQARELALQKYRRLFANAYLKDPVTGDFRRYAPLNIERFSSVQASGNAWLVQTEGDAGWQVVARVDKGGDWVEIVKVDYATH